MKSSDLRLLLTRSGSRRIFFVAIAAALFWSAAIVVSALILSSLITNIINHEGNVPALLLYLACAWSFRAIFQSVFEFWCSRQAVRIKQELRSEISQTLGAHAQVSASHISTLLVKGLNSLDIYLGRFLPQILFASITPFVVIATIFFLDPLSAVIAIFTLPLIPLFGALIGRYTADSVSSKWQTLGSLSKYFEDSLRGFVTLKIFSRHKSQNQRIEAMGNRYTQETMKVLRISFLSALALELCATISVALIAVSIGIRLVDSHIGFMPALAVLILAPEVYFPLRNAASLFHASADGTQALRELNEMLNSGSSKPTQHVRDFSTLQSISWDAWNLDIPGRINLEIPSAKVNRGEIHFIFGDSGSGKTSFAMNLLGVTNSAQIYCDGVQLTPSDQDSWFKTVGWIPQAPALAFGNVRKQFTLIDPAITDNRISSLLDQCGLKLEDLPGGLECRVGGSGENGSSLSGGQIRKIAIARALLAQPLIVIADEPTADLDQLSADQILHTLRSYASAGAIVICISHDLSILKVDDQLSRFSHGVIA